MKDVFSAKSETKLSRHGWIMYLGARTTLGRKGGVGRPCDPHAKSFGYTNTLLSDHIISNKTFLLEISILPF